MYKGFFKLLRDSKRKERMKSCFKDIQDDSLYCLNCNSRKECYEELKENAHNKE